MTHTHSNVHSQSNGSDLGHSDGVGPLGPLASITGDWLTEPMRCYCFLRKYASVVRTGARRSREKTNITGALITQSIQDLFNLTSIIKLELILTSVLNGDV
ncbi:hypothetical protein CHARACLAT_021240 [Characodon lateralis]|uniref:Uncharacterized protein n=1 Tax=Characodon lateralis TaxID=208331 RepID=A0ABU7EW33_9TELE|nr:hypothetical protein [Characodon lateralis]